MNENIVAIVLSIIAFFGIVVTGYYTYKGTKATAQVDAMQQKITELEAENKLLWKMIKDCQENKVDK